MPPRPDETLIAALRIAYVTLSAGGSMGTPERCSLEAAPAAPYHCSRLRLAFLAPDILKGRRPVDLQSRRLITGVIPFAWADQREAFGCG